jgi:hypothetical protein
MRMRDKIEPWLTAAIITWAMVLVYNFVSDSVEPPEYPCRSIQVANKVLDVGTYDRPLTDLEIDIIAKLTHGAYSYNELIAVCRHE